MRPAFQDIKELTDSRELLESKPHHFSSIFVCLVLILVCTLLVWCWFGEKEVFIKANGIVRPREGIYIVANTVSSKVESISFNNGQKVKKGDTLYTLDHTEIDLQKKITHEKIETLSQDVENLKQLKKSVLDDKNRFDKNNEKEKYYYDKYLNYEVSNIHLPSYSSEGINRLYKEKNKAAMSVQTDNDIKTNEEKLKDLEYNLEAINMNIQKCTIKSLNSGILDAQVDLNIGDIVQAGTIIANILPNDSEYKVDLIILDKDIANIKEGQNIKYSFPSLPYNEYGFLNGKIEDISADSKINKSNGISFYTAEVYIYAKEVYTHKGEKAEIKNGMTCEVQIVTRKEKMLYYLLEELNLKS